MWQFSSFSRVLQEISEKKQAKIHQNILNILDFFDGFPTKCAHWNSLINRYCLVNLIQFGPMDPASKSAITSASVPQNINVLANNYQTIFKLVVEECIHVIGLMEAYMQNEW